MKKHLAISTLIVLVTATLAACGSDGGQESAGPVEASTSTAPSPSATAPPPGTATPSAGAGATPSGGTTAGAPATSRTRVSGAVEITAAGSDVAVGDTVTVPATYAHEEFVVRLTVTAIEQGSSTDLEGIGLNEDPATLVPYYIRVTGELVSGNGSHYDPAADLDGLSGERTASPLITRGSFAPCEGQAFEADARRGSRVRSCTTAVVPVADEVDAAMYSASDTDYDMFDGEPIIWR